MDFGKIEIKFIVMNDTERLLCKFVISVLNIFIRR